MRVLVIGAGAREHALVWKLAQSQRVSALYAAPGNPGMAEQAECVPIAVTQLQALADFAEGNNIDLTVVGPEVPLVEGIADIFRQRGLRIFGPGAAGAALEGSKAFAKALMTTAGIPTAQHRTFTIARDAFAYLEEHGAPVVVKADGNAAGKGAIVALDMQTAREAVRQMMVERVFGAAGDVVVIEDYLQGDEIGSTIVCKGTHYLPLALTQDHKRALDGDAGLNTGGMGAYTPLPFVDKAVESQIYRQIVAPTLQALKERGIDFSGVLYSNIMLTARGPMVLGAQHALRRPRNAGPHAAAARRPHQRAGIRRYSACQTQHALATRLRRQPHPGLRWLPRPVSYRPAHSWHRRGQSQRRRPRLPRGNRNSKWPTRHCRRSRPQRRRLRPNPARSRKQSLRSGSAYLV